jgi:hypothetical protein
LKINLSLSIVAIGSELTRNLINPCITYELFDSPACTRAAKIKYCLSFELLFVIVRTGKSTPPKDYVKTSYLAWL